MSKHFYGKTYDLTQKNMQQIIDELDQLKSAADKLAEALDDLISECPFDPKLRSAEQALKEYRGEE